MKKGYGSITGEDFRRMQLLELDMLIELDRVCRKHNIRYSISCGTLLGAVRHKGFIPWDDDADVAMLREDYNEFRKHIDELDPNICFFQDHDVDPEYIWGYGKLRKTGTTYIRPGQEKQLFKNGVYVDIMPMDDIPKSLFFQIVNNFYCFFLRKVLWSRIGKDDMDNPFLIRILYRLLSFIPINSVYKRLNRMASKSSNKSDNPVKTLLLPSGGTEKSSMYKAGRNPGYLIYGIPKDWMLDLVEYDFEGRKLLGIRESDKYLESRFGNYMELPPESKRIPKAPAAIWEF